MKEIELTENELSEINNCGLIWIVLGIINIGMGFLWGLNISNTIESVSIITTSIISGCLFVEVGRIKKDAKRLSLITNKKHLNSVQELNAQIILLKKKLFEIEAKNIEASNKSGVRQ